MTVRDAVEKNVKATGTKRIAYYFLLSFLLLVFSQVLSYFNSSIYGATPIGSRSVELEGVTPRGETFFAASDGPHVITVDAPFLNRFQRIAYQFEISGHGTASTVIRFDAFGPDYDLPSKENAHSLLSEGLPKTFKGTIQFWKTPPPGTKLRIFFESPAGLEVNGVRIGVIPFWRVLVEYLLLLSGSLLLFRGLYAAWRSNSIDQVDARKSIGCTLAVIFLIGVLIRFAVSLFLPYWSGDEYTYKQIAAAIWNGNLLTLAGSQVGQQVNIPNLLYPYLVSPAFALGDDFYVGIRLINAILISSALFPAYAIAWKLTRSSAISLSIGVFALVMPSANISAFAVTETAFHPLMLLGIYLTMESASRPNSLARAILLGAVIGIATNVRMPAIVLLIVYYLTILLSIARSVERASVLARPSWLIVAPSAAFFYLTVRWLLVPASTSGMGVYASGEKGWLMSALSTAGGDVTGAWWLLAGHMAILAVPYSLALASTISGVISPPEENLDRRIGATVVLLSFLGAFGMTVLFTLSVSGHDLGGLGRWHSRYYFSTLPPLFAYLFYWIGVKKPISATGISIFWAVFASIVVGASLFVFMRSGLQSEWFGSTVDSMEVQWARNHTVGYSLALMTTCLLALMIVRRVTEVRTLTLYFLAGFLLVSNFGSLRLLAKPPAASANRCGEFVAEYLQQSPDTFMVLHQGRGELVDIAFWVPYTPAQLYEVPSGTTKTTWPTASSPRLLVTESLVEVEGGEIVASSDRCKIYRRVN